MSSCYPFLFWCLRYCISSPSHYHHPIEKSNHKALFKPRCWNNVRVEISPPPQRHTHTPPPPPPVPNILVGELCQHCFPVASHYLNQHWLIVHLTLRNKPQIIKLQHFHSWIYIWKCVRNGSLLVRGRWVKSQNLTQPWRSTGLIVIDGQSSNFPLVLD